MNTVLLTSLDDVLGSEERIVNCWPAVSTMLMQGFVVRFANGYSGRANSASPILAGADLDDARIETIENLYRSARLPPAFRDTPLMTRKTRRRLDCRGYQIKDSSEGMLIDLSARRFSAHPGVEFMPEPCEPWLSGISRFQVQEKRSPAHLLAIVGAIRVPVYFARLLSGGLPVAFGMVAIDRGWAEIASIMVDPADRGRGHGRALTEALLAQAQSVGAQKAFLQVDITNEAAKALYRKLGFAGIYRYDTLRKSN
ncbi:NAT_SF domain containing protein [Rhabdaerophilaceae bacterium]